MKGHERPCKAVQGYTRHSMVKKYESRNQMITYCYSKRQVSFEVYCFNDFEQFLFGGVVFLFKNVWSFMIFLSIWNIFQSMQTRKTTKKVSYRTLERCQMLEVKKNLINCLLSDFNKLLDFPALFSQLIRT